MKSIAGLLMMISVTCSIYAADGMTNVKSKFSVKKTADQLISILNDKGMTIFNRINHSDSAAKIGIEIRDTELIIFGNPKVGSLLMKCQQSIALDLPLKALVWQDQQQKVWISYNAPNYLKQRHQIVGCDKVLAKIEQALVAITTLAANKEPVK
jgi:uncharacterized protein (DUF302 family)